MQTAYVYKWTELSTNRYYIGSRTSKNAHPDDGYICSSKIIKKFIESNPNNWTREILFIGDPIEMRLIEQKLLTHYNIVNDPNSYNGTTITNLLTEQDTHSKVKEAIQYYYNNNIEIPFSSWFKSDCKDIKYPLNVIKTIDQKISIGYSYEEIIQWMTLTNNLRLN